ncbi:MAG: glycosyltransferase family 4 protein [Candidatus Pacebacteria bacterium]|nr:glycosyltransferase family 4 protein [Candidatus Paceibacterota bacterium]
MKILMVSTDEQIFQEGSEAYLRMRDYGNLFSELHIIIFSRKKRERKRIRENVFIYPVYSFLRFIIPFKAFFESKKIIKESEFRVTTQDPYETGIVGFLLKIFYKTKWQAQIHTDLLSKFFFRQSLKNKIRVFLAKAIIGKADRIRAVSERIKNSLLEWGIEEEKIDVLPIAINAGEIKNAPIIFDLKEKFPQFDFRALTVSRLTPEKNIRVILAALAEIVKKKPKTGLVIAGSGECLDDLKMEVKEKKIEDNVIFTGKLSFLEAIGAMKTADVFLSSSVYEGYGMAVAEAMAAGCPVIMTDTGLANEVLKNRESGLVVKIGNKKEIAEAIDFLMENKEEREKIIEGAKREADNFIEQEEYLKKFKEILEK